MEIDESPHQFQTQEQDANAASPSPQIDETSAASKPSEEETTTHQSNMEESTTTTITSIKTALDHLNTSGDYSVFISPDVVTRPPFPYFYGLVQFIARSKPELEWKKLLVFEDDNMIMPRNKKEKLSFLVRLLAVVSEISQYRYDMFISPTNILCGQDVLTTHQFVRALVASALVSSEDMARVVSNVLDKGDGSLYKRAVRTRSAFKRLQARVRGWSVRKQYPIKKLNDPTTANEDVQQIDDSNNLNSSPEPKAKTKTTSATDALLESYQEMLARKSKVEDELKLAEERLKQENDKLARILNIGSTHKKQSRQPLPAEPLRQLRAPYSAPSNGFGRKGPIATGSRTTHLQPLPQVDDAFVERITNLSVAERETKKKAKRIEERERTLKQRLIRSKQQEEELKLQETRISDIADKIRRQQLQLKEQKLHFEQSKLEDLPAPPDTTSRPCEMCTEKEMRLRDVKDKVKRRMRQLREREAEVIGRARALRIREKKLLQLQNDLAEQKQREHTNNPKTSGESISHRNKRSKAVARNRRDDHVGNKSNHLKGGIKRKRRVNSDDEGTGVEKQSDTDDETDQITSPAEEAVVTSIRSSFSEAVPTIVEEPQLPADEEDSLFESDNNDGDVSLENVVDAIVTEAATEISDDGSGVEEKPKGKQSQAVRPFRVPTLNESVNRKSIKKHDETKRATQLKSKTSSPSPSPVKQRHVFTFEKKRHSEKTTRHISRDNESHHSSSRSSKRDRRGDDDWVSSFDVQMKCAMNKLMLMG